MQCKFITIKSRPKYPIDNRYNNKKHIKVKIKKGKNIMYTYNKI